MKTNKLTALLAALTLGCGASTLLAQVTPPAEPPGTPGGDGIRQRDRLQEMTPDLDQQRTRAYQTLPTDVKKAVQDMKQAREQYQQEKRELKKEMVGATDQERERLREQLKECVKDQVRDREQIRERLREMRECLPSHQELMEQARERTRDRDRRGE
jgi:Spy/CpxP family protein refolding chaperone